MEIEGIDISHPDKLIFPEMGITKKDMAGYYAKVADRMLPYLKDRPLSLQRFPNGIDEDGFFQKNAGDYFPDFVERVRIETRDGTNEQVICNSKRTLIYLVNQGTVTFHIWLSRKDKLHRPDRVVFDLDPPENSFDKVKDAASKVGDFLRENDLDPKLMTTGKSGLHVWYEKRRDHDFDEVRERARAMAHEMAERYPDLMTTETRINKREDRIFIDYLRNAYGQTVVCPYSLRPVTQAGVATPIEWSELSALKAADQYHYGNIFRRLGQK